MRPSLDHTYKWTNILCQLIAIAYFSNPPPLPAVHIISIQAESYNLEIIKVLERMLHWGLLFLLPKKQLGNIIRREIEKKSW